MGALSRSGIRLILTRRVGFDRLDPRTAKAASIRIAHARPSPYAGAVHAVSFARRLNPKLRRC